MPVVAPAVIVAPTTKPVTEFNYVFSVLEGVVVFCQSAEKDTFDCYGPNQQVIGVRKGQKYEFMGHEFKILKILTPGLVVEVTGGGKTEIITVKLNTEVALEKGSLRDIRIREGWTHACEMGSVKSGFLHGLDVSEILLAEKSFSQFFNSGHFVVFIPASKANNFTNSLIVRHNNTAWVFAQLAVKNEDWEIPGLGIVAERKGSWRFFSNRRNGFGLKEKKYGFKYQQDPHTRKLPFFAFKVTRLSAKPKPESISAKPISAESISAKPISAESISAESISAKSISAESISAELIFPKEFYAELIFPESVSAKPKPNSAEICGGANGEDVEASHNGNEDAVRNVSSKKSIWSKLKRFFPFKRKDSYNC